MDLGRLTTTTEEQALIGMVQYYSYLCPSQSHVLSPLTETYIIPKGIKCFEIV